MQKCDLSACVCNSIMSIASDETMNKQQYELACALLPRDGADMRRDPAACDRSKPRSGIQASSRHCLLPCYTAACSHIFDRQPQGKQSASMLLTRRAGIVEDGLRSRPHKTCNDIPMQGHQTTAHPTKASSATPALVKLPVSTLVQSQ